MTLPMHVIGLVLVCLSRAREASLYVPAPGVREYVVPAGGWADRCFRRFGFVALTPAATIII